MPAVQRTVTGKTPRLSKSELQQGAVLSIDNAIRLLESAEVLVKVNLSHAYVFYNLAMEEYGKALWLREIEKNAAPSERYEVGQVFRKHETKLEKARAMAPSSCTEIMRGLKLGVNSKMIPKTLWYNVEVDRYNFKRATKSVVIPPGATGKFFDVSPGDIVDFGARLEALYVDCFYVGSGNQVQWSNEIVPTAEAFQQAVKDFRQHLSASP